MKKKPVYLLSLSVAVCSAALIFPLTAAAQGTSSSKTKTTQKVAGATKAETTPTVSVSTETNTVEKSSKVAFISSLEQEIIDEMNIARTDPQKYAGFIEEFKKYYDGNRLTIPGRKKAIITNEGIAAVDEAIAFLRAQKPQQAFQISKGVCRAAADHATDLAGKGISGHRGSDGSTPNTRVDRYGEWEAAIGETIVYEVTSPRNILIALIIDDGVPNRGHRRNIFDPNYKLTGISVSEPLSFGSKCVIAYVGGFRENEPDSK